MQVVGGEEDDVLVLRYDVEVETMCYVLQWAARSNERSLS